MRNIRIGFAIFWTLLIPLVCLINLSNVKEVQYIAFPHIDKIVHFGLYTTLAFLWMWSTVIPEREKSFFKNAFFIFVLATFFGIGIEWLQDNYTLTRAAEILDVLSNCLGVLFGILLSRLIIK